MSLCVACSTLGYVNTAIFATSRMAMAAAREKHLPKVFALIQVQFGYQLIAEHKWLLYVIVKVGVTACVRPSIGDQSVHTTENYKRPKKYFGKREI